MRELVVVAQSGSKDLCLWCDALQGDFLGSPFLAIAAVSVRDVPEVSCCFCSTRDIFILKRSNYSGVRGGSPSSRGCLEAVQVCPGGALTLCRIRRPLLMVGPHVCGFWDERGLERPRNKRGALRAVAEGETGRFRAEAIWLGR